MRVCPVNPKRYRNNNSPSVSASVVPSSSMSRYTLSVCKYDSISLAVDRLASPAIAPSVNVVPEKPNRCLRTSKPSVKASFVPSPSISNVSIARTDGPPNKASEIRTTQADRLIIGWDAFRTIAKATRRSVRRLGRPTPPFAHATRRLLRLMTRHTTHVGAASIDKYRFDAGWR